MSTIADFKKAPIGTTATHTDGSRAMKMDRPERNWSTPEGVYLDDVGMKLRGYAIDPPTPTTVNDALDLAWGIAHEVKEGQHIPKGVRLLDRLDRNDFSVYTTQVDFTINAREALSIRILDPLSDTAPDWLNAPAIIARRATWKPDDLRVFTPSAARSRWTTDGITQAFYWSELVDVTPLYPKETET